MKMWNEEVKKLTFNKDDEKRKTQNLEDFSVKSLNHKTLWNQHKNNKFKKEKSLWNLPSGTRCGCLYVVKSFAYNNVTVSDHNNSIKLFSSLFWRLLFNRSTSFLVIFYIRIIVFHYSNITYGFFLCFYVLLCIFVILVLRLYNLFLRFSVVFKWHFLKPLMIHCPLSLYS